MNEENKFVLEKLGEMFDAFDENKDLLKGLIDICKETNLNSKAIRHDTNEINMKLDNILEKIMELVNSFSDFKNEVRDVDQKLILMSSKLDVIEVDLDRDEFEEYYALSQSMYSNWEEMDELTRKFIPIAEYLFSKLQKCKCIDYSPVIIELCRAIENELLLKLFGKYTLDLINKIGKENLDDFLYKDKSDKFLCNKTGIFVKAIKKAVRTHSPQYTLGQMNAILSMMNEEKIISNSTLMKDFKIYLGKRTNINDLLDEEFIKRIDSIVKDFRNPSAHPEFMTLKKASECKAIMPESIDYFLDCIITN